MFQYQYQPNDGTRIGFKILAEGPAQFMITEATDRDENNYPLKDSAGFPKFSVKLKVKDSLGNVGLIEETFSGSSKASWKIGQLLESVDMSQEYNQSGQLDLQKLVGKRGRATIYINKYKKRDGADGQNMKVRDFINPNPPQAQQAAQSHQAGLAPPVQAYSNMPQADQFDDIPF